MKKRQFKIILILISFIFLIYVIATTFSKYVSNASGSASIRIAKWNVKVGDVELSSVGEHDISTEIQMVPQNNNGVIDGKIAPESEMIGSFTIDPQDTETDIEYKITIGDFEYTEENEVLPNMQITKITVNEADITLAEGNTYTGAINIGDGIVDVKVYAKWNSGDSDYLIGENITTIKLPISVYVEQSNKSEI